MGVGGTSAGLSELRVRAAKPREKAYRISDARGLYLWVTPAGGKLWRWAYVFQGKEKLMSFGKYPDVGLSAARELHQAERRRLASGIDPMAERKAVKVAQRAAAGDSFRSIAELWYAHWRQGKAEHYAQDVERRLARNILPKLGARPITAIEAPELVAMAKALEARGVPHLAKRALETSGQIFRYAIANGYAKRNPAADIKPGDVLRAAPTKNMARIDARELPELLRAIEVYDGSPVTRLAMNLMALTFLRTSELIGARWEEFDLEARRWNLPAARMKMRTPHIVPLSRQALEVLTLLRVASGPGPLLFPGDRKSDQPMSNNTILHALWAMGYKGRMTGHGFRGVASTLLHEQGYEHEHIELQLAHAPRNSVSAAYNHARYLAPRAKMMQDWADFLEDQRRGG